MLKKRIRKWLGIVDLEEQVLTQHAEQAELDIAYSRLKNLYDSNRARIDQVRENHIQTREVMLARIIALEALNTALLKTKQKKPTPKKGK